MMPTKQWKAIKLIKPHSPLTEMFLKMAVRGNCGSKPRSLKAKKTGSCFLCAGPKKPSYDTKNLVEDLPDQKWRCSILLCDAACINVICMEESSEGNLPFDQKHISNGGKARYIMRQDGDILKISGPIKWGKKR